MASHEPVSLDTAAEIRELATEGYGRNTISYMTGIPSSTVRNILEGIHQTFDSKLTNRQRTNLLAAAFRPQGRKPCV